MEEIQSSAKYIQVLVPRCYNRIESDGLSTAEMLGGPRSGQF